MRKGLRWIPRHPETRKGVVSDEMLRGIENKHRSGDSRIGEAVECCTLDGESPVAESITSLRSDPSSMGHVESRVNQQGPPCKAKYSWVTDSEAVAWLREPTGAVAKASLHRAIVTAYGPEPGGEMPLEPRASWFSPKCVEAQQLTGHLGVKHCFGAGRESAYNFHRTVLSKEQLFSKSHSKGAELQQCYSPGPLVLGKGPLNALTPTPDMDRTVSRRSEPSSRTALMGEQPNPWNILQPQVAKSRHRGAKPSRRCELLGKISLLSLEANLRPARGNLCTPPLPFGRPTPHRNCLPETVPWPVQVVRIFTDMSISPSLSPRQCPDRYAFRAGRNLPDKEFRYLRTVIVTAAVHRGFGRRLPCHQVTNFLDLPALGRRQPPYMVLRLCGDLCFWISQFYFSMGAGKGYNSAVECHLDVVEVISSSLIIPKPNGWLYFWERTPGEYEAHGYKLGLGMKDNSESALSTNKEAISNATMNLMESSILAQDERWRHA
ncbi:hypothetical protein E3N88_25331 [Mikania micrantha]|uniref:Uncharacterized protein n=2 Tax=Heliantheae alliance TaxID=911341 RepID=A0A5N6N5S8_9ASTR|nr:hypothetical protein E3N88_25331 [Mikania micrantha]